MNRVLDAAPMREEMRQFLTRVADYTGSPEEMGKNVGDDLAEGKPTMPLIYTINKGTPEQSAIMHRSK